MQLQFNSESFGHKQHLKQITGRNPQLIAQRRELNGQVGGKLPQNFQMATIFRDITIFKISKRCS